MSTRSTNSATAISFEKDEAICLNIRPFSKTSQMVTWLTRDHGCITTPIKGAQRPKSGFMGAYDIGYTCEVVYYAHNRNGVHHIRECSPLCFRETLRAHWRAAATAAYACGLTLRTAQPDLANPALYAHLTHLLDNLAACPAEHIPLAMLWFESNLLHATGLMPDFTLCERCPTPALNFSVEDGYFICPHRPQRAAHTAPTLTMHPEIIELFALFLTRTIDALLEEAARRTAIAPEPFPGIFGLRRFLGLFLNEHLDLLPGPRRTLLDLLLSGECL